MATRLPRRQVTAAPLWPSPPSPTRWLERPLLRAAWGPSAMAAVGVALVAVAGFGIWKAFFPGSGVPAGVSGRIESDDCAGGL